MRLLSLLTSSLVVLSLNGCWEKVSTRESDLAKYPELSIFWPKMKDFRSGEHNLDRATFSFSFSSEYEDAASFFHAVDSSAIADDWAIVSESVGQREYVKVTNPGAPGMDREKISLTYNEETGRIHFLIQPYP